MNGKYDGLTFGVEIFDTVDSFRVRSCAGETTITLSNNIDAEQLARETSVLLVERCDDIKNAIKAGEDMHITIGRRFTEAAC